MGTVCGISEEESPEAQFPHFAVFCNILKMM